MRSPQGKGYQPSKQMKNLPLSAKKKIVAIAALLALSFSAAYAVIFPLQLTLNLIGVDSTPPSINITPLGATSDGNVTVSGTYSEENTIANITVEVNSSHVVPASINTGARTWSAAINLAEGWNRFYVMAYDAAGNFVNATSSSQGASILSDNTNPTINLTSPANASTVANNSLITFKISDLYLSDAFYTINNGATTSFNSVYEIRAGTSEWADGENYIIVNATDTVNNVQRKNFTFVYSNTYDAVLNSSISTAQAEINSTNSTLSTLQSAESLTSLVETFPAEISVQEYNETLQTLDVVSNLTSAVSAIETLLQEILAANSSGSDNSTKTAAINAKLEQITVIKNTTVASVDVNLFNSNLTVAVENTTMSNVTETLITAASGLSAADQQAFREASAELQNKTTITNSVQTLTKTFLNGRTENITLFEKNISISQTQSGEFYVNEFVDKNITGNNDLNGSTDITNRATQSMTVVEEDPIVRWTFSDTAGAVVKYTVDKNVPSSKVAESKTVVTTVPGASSSSASSTDSSSSAASASSGGGGGKLGDPKIAVSRETLKVILRQTESKTETFSIRNNGDTPSNVEVNLDALKRFITPESFESFKSPIRLLPGEEKIIEIIFTAAESIIPDVYPFEIILSNIFGEKRIAAIIEVESSKPLFDVDLEVLPEYKNTMPGNKILMEVSIFNLRGFGRVDVNAEYSVRDLSGNIYTSGHETLAVETEVKFTRELLLPSDLKPGVYIASARVNFEEFAGTSSDLFNVGAKTISFGQVGFKSNTLNLLLVFIIALFVVFVALIYEYGIGESKYFKSGGSSREIQRNLSKKLRVIEEGYYSGAISKKTYERLKGDLNAKLKRKNENAKN